MNEEFSVGVEQLTELQNQLHEERKARQLAEDRLCSILYAPFMAGQTCRDLKSMQESYTDVRLELALLKSQGCRSDIPLEINWLNLITEDLAAQFYNDPANQKRAAELIRQKLTPGLVAGARRANECQQLRHLLRMVFYARNVLGTKLCDELEEWGVQHLAQEIVEVLEGKKYADETATV